MTSSADPRRSRCDPRHAAGRIGERLAAEHLERLGLTVLGRNVRTRWGELDLIAHDRRFLVFVEVKTRRGDGGRPFDALDAAKQGQVRRMAAHWLAVPPDRPRARELRFDAIGVTLDGRDRLVRLQHVEAAF